MPERLTPFAFEEQLVRCRLDERGEPWFVAKDVALALGYQWAGIRNVQHIPEEWRLVESVSTSFGDKHVWFAAYLFGQLSTFVIAYVSWRCTYQT